MIRASFLMINGPFLVNNLRFWEGLGDSKILFEPDANKSESDAADIGANCTLKKKL